MRIRTRVNPIAFQDRRTDEQRRHSDNVEVKRWRARVWLREKHKQYSSRRPL